MMEARKLDQRCSGEWYLAYDRSFEGRAEYHDGFIVDMAGGTKIHSQIAFNIGLAIQLALGPDECNTYIADARVQAKKSTLTSIQICGLSVLSQKKGYTVHA